MKKIYLLGITHCVIAPLSAMDVRYPATSLDQAMNGRWQSVFGKIYGMQELNDIRKLVEKGVSIETKNAKGKTALQIGLEKCRTNDCPSFFGYERVLALLACGATISSKEFDWFLPRQLPYNYQIYFPSRKRLESQFIGICCEAACKGDLLDDNYTKLGINTKLEQILAHKDAQDPVFGMTGAMWAAARGNLKLLTKLYELGCNFTLQDVWGYTVLHFAVLNNHLETARFIIQKVPITSCMKNKSEQNPIDLALSLKRSKDFLTMLRDELSKTHL